LTTIGTPHLGTRFADWGKEQHLDGAIKMLRELIDLEGFLTLTTADTVAFNRRSEHFEATNDVFYQTYASFEEKEHVFGLLRFSWKKIAEQKTVNEDKKKNDGLVPLHSQRWTDKLVGNNGEIKQITQHDFPFPADHLNQIGWWDFDELNKSEWWKVNLLEEKKAFEMAVRQVYLQIANDVKAL
ncbi:MAG: hypothetical protein GY805_34975, partial [Chloroflexi bacterium]|nr:hypothetical protein [Chloroflexota bacterium]